MKHCFFLLVTIVNIRNVILLIYVSFIFIKLEYNKKYLSA